MKITLDTSAMPPRLALAGEMTIYAAAELHSRLLAPLDACSGLDIDLSAIDEIDSSGVQLLILARQHAAAAGKPLGLVAPSQPVRDLLELYDLADFLADQPDAGEPA